MEQGDISLFFLYDQNGLFGFDKISGTTKNTFYYRIDARGEIVAIVNAYGNVVANYTYDAWGNPISVTNGSGNSDLDSTHVARLNPFRYKSYVYDNETGLYYLNSRYYDPQVCRFVSRDEFEVLTLTPTGLTDKNLFSYCDNNPVMRRDVSGQAWETVFDVVSLGFSIAEVAANPYDISAWAGLVGDTIDLIPIVTGVGETIRGLRFVDKAGNTLEIAKATDFTEEAIEKINQLEKVNGFTKSTRGAGIEIHNGYKYGPQFTSDYKEYKKITGIRPDYYDKKTIFELKPFNPRSAKLGVSQLRRYNNALGGGKIMRLEFY